MELKRKIGRKSLVVLLALTMILSMFSSVFAAGSSDVDGHWAEKQLNQWIDNGLLNGYGEGVYKPNQTITRAEAAALVNRSFEHEATAEISFPEVESVDWFYNEVSKAVAAGFMTGYADETFKPDQNITRQELAVMIFRLLDLEANAEAVDSYDDVANIADWAKGEIGALVDLGIVTGYKDNTIQPEGLTKRAEAIVMIERAFEYMYTYNEAGTYGPEEGIETITHNVTVTASDVTLQNLVIEGDLLLAEGIGEGDVYLNNVTVKGTTTILGGGENSVHLTDTVLVTVIVDKKNGSIRIVVKGKSEVKEITLNSGAKLEESDIDGAGFTDVILSSEIAKNANVELVGDFEEVKVFAVSVSIEIPEGSVENLNVDETAEGVELDLGKDATIVELVLDAVTEVLGDGTVESVEGDQAEESNVETDDVPVSSGNGGSGGSGSTTPGNAEVTEAYVQLVTEMIEADKDGDEFSLTLPSDENAMINVFTLSIGENTGIESVTFSDGEKEGTVDFNSEGDAFVPASLFLGSIIDSQRDGVSVKTVKANVDGITVTATLDGSVTPIEISLSYEVDVNALVFSEASNTLKGTSIGIGETFKANDEVPNTFEFTIGSGLDDTDMVVSFVIEAENADRLYVGGIPFIGSENFYFDGGIATLSVSELLDSLDPQGDGVSVGKIKDEFEENTFSIPGKLFDEDGNYDTVTLKVVIE